MRLMAVARAARTMTMALAHRLRYGAPHQVVHYGDCFELRCECGGSALVFPGSMTLFWRTCPTLTLYRQRNLALRVPARAIIVSR